MNVEIGTEAPIFLFWEYLFQIFGILSLQCGVESDSKFASDGRIYSTTVDGKIYYKTMWEFTQKKYFFSIYEMKISMFPSIYIKSNYSLSL
jgi:hypothetical protein